MRVKIAAFNFLRLRNCTGFGGVLASSGKCMRGGPGPLSPRGTHKTSTVGWADGECLAWSLPHPPLGAERAAEKNRICYYV